MRTSASTTRVCDRPGCSNAAAVRLLLDVRRYVVVVDSKMSEPGAAAVLCALHSERIIAPQGWTIDDRHTRELRLFPLSRRERPADPPEATQRSSKRRRGKAAAAPDPLFEGEGEGHTAGGVADARQANARDADESPTESSYPLPAEYADQATTVTSGSGSESDDPGANRDSDGTDQQSSTVEPGSRSAQARAALRGTPRSSALPDSDRSPLLARAFESAFGAPFGSGPPGHGRPRPIGSLIPGAVAG